MATFESEFLHRAEVAAGTMAFRFSRPGGFDFRAGQAMTLTLVNPRQTDAKGNRRTFSIASAPSEDTLMIATRMRDTAFKRTLKAMPRGTPVQLRGPVGNFVLDAENERPIVMLAGGIGITPFLSMLRQAASDALRRRLHLFYSNRTPRSAPFLEQLRRLESRNPRFRLTATMTDLEDSDEQWDGARGVIDVRMLSRGVPDLREPSYYVAGPPAMVTSMRKLLAAADVSTEQIRTDEFFGY
jgi:ferredoxin-NADP reductase